MSLTQERLPPQQKSIALEGLLFQTLDGRWSHLPEWAQGFILFGYHLGLNRAKEHRWVVAVNVPCRDYAALFVTAGIVLARLSHNLSVDEQTHHFETLCTLPLRTGVVIWQGGKRQRGTIESQLRNGSSRQLRIQTNRNEAATIIGLQSAYLVEPIKEEVNPSGSHLSTSRNPFLFAQHDFTAPLQPHSWTDSLLISNGSRLEQESALKLRWSTNDLNGTLGDLCAVDAFVPAGQIHRTVLLPTTSDEYSPIQLRSNSIVIFDSSNAYLRHHHTLPANNCVVIVCPDEAGHSETISELNRAFATRLKDFDGSLDGLPNGVEVMAWLEQQYAN
jgi:hypothetical protein